ncbi:cation:proton antiporter [Candidatus Woesearchaeota archaeon]|nr:cation:proton antiporter [Candidatus Woesearchaeota archaeon]
MIAALMVLLVLFVSWLFVRLGSKLKVPAVVSLIFAGISLSTPPLRGIIIYPNEWLIFSLADAGLIALMLLAGFESSWNVMYKERKDSLVIALFASLFPLAMGFFVFRLLGFSVLVSAIVGISMSITAEATKAKVLLDLKKLRTKVGSAMMGAGILDEIVGISLFLIVTYLFKATYLKEDLLLAGTILSFFAGVWIQQKVRRDSRAVRYIEKGLFLAVIPFFFVSIGMYFDLASLLINPTILIVLMATAMAGKIIGTMISKPFTRLSLRQLYLIGWAMNSRGAVEIALALIAFRSGMIPVELYSGLVAMALFTTFLFTVIVSRKIRKCPSIMG